MFSNVLSVLLILLLVSFFGWYMLGNSTLASTVAVTPIVWKFLVATILLLSVATLIVQIISRLKLLIVVAATLVWTAVIVILFPHISPAIIPIFVVLIYAICTSIIRHKSHIRSAQISSMDDDVKSPLNKN